MPAEQEPRYIEAEGDKPKVERTRHYFAAIYAGLKTAEEYGRELTLENERLQAKLQAAHEEIVRLDAEVQHLKAWEPESEFRDELQAAQEREQGANTAASDYEAWLGAALRALGVKTIFDIPNYREHLQAAIKEQSDEALAALAAQRTEEPSDDEGLEPIETSPLTEREPDL